MDNPAETPPQGLTAMLKASEDIDAEKKSAEAREALKRAGLLPVKASDLLKEKLPPPEWLLEDLIASRGGGERGFKGDLIAPSKMRKTFFGLQLAASVSAGSDFLGWNVPRPARVLYLNLELPKYFAQERLLKQAKALGADLGNLEIITPTKPYLLRNRKDRDGTKLEGYEDEIILLIREERYKLVVLDPQYKLMHPEEAENTGEGIGGILRFRDDIITKTEAAVLTLHHDAKGDAGSRAITDRGAGSGFAGRDYDFRLTLTADADGDPDHEVLEASSRVRPSPDPKALDFSRETFSFSVNTDRKGEKKTAKPPKLSPAEREARHRDAVERATQTIFADLATQLKAKLKEREATPRDFLLGTASFKSYLMQRADIGITACNEQTKALLEKKTLATQRELKLVDGKAAKAGATILIGTPELVGKYRESFGLDPNGEELRK